MTAFLLALLLDAIKPFAAPAAPACILGAAVAGGAPPAPARAFNISSSSMAPTLIVGDVLLVSLDDAYSPARGDVIVFTLTAQPDIDYIKRVVALPGDRIALHDGTPVLNGAPLAEQDDGNDSIVGDLGAGAQPIRRYTAPMPAAAHSIARFAHSGPGQTMAEITVPPGRLFVLGDNRDNSLDSRFPQFGLVPIQRVVGPAQTIYWSPDPNRFLRHVH